jgi:hypothetical protein
MKKIAAIFIIFFYCLVLQAQVKMPLDTLFNQFQMVKKMCDKDNGKLWGINLYGPILIVDQISKMVVANQQDNEGLLKKKGNVYVGSFPENGIIACGVIEFGGKIWVILPYFVTKNKDTLELCNVCIHESFHRIQGEFDLECRYNNFHMDKMYARIYLNLEWQALIRAVESLDEKRMIAIKDALLFREERRKIYPGADTMESNFEIHEGLANYTGYKLCFKSDLALKEKLLQYRSNYLDDQDFLYPEDNYVRSFGYFSGFLYACLLDETRSYWRKDLTCGVDLGLLLQRSLKIDIAKDTTNLLNQAKERYRYEEIYKRELNANIKKEKILSDYIIRFTQKPVMILDMIEKDFGVSCSPYPLDTLGNVYPKIIISQKWGYLEVSDKGCLITPNIDKAIITADNIQIDDQIITGTGWTLNLNKNWIVEKGKDNYFIKEKK